MSKNFYIIGFPESGKTSFVGALGYYLISGNQDTSELKFDEANDIEYINKVASEWVKCEKVGRTNKNVLYHVQLNLIDKQKNKIVISLPDQSGEMFRDIVNNRGVSEEQYAQLDNCEEVLVFINPSKIKKDTLIPEIPEMIRESASDDNIEFSNKSLISIQAEYVQILKYLYYVRHRKTRIKIIVSAWDMYVKDRYKEPEQVLKDKLPLIWQYLHTNEEYFECEYWGISAQGGNLDNKKTQKRLAEYDNPDKRILIVDSFGKKSNDITKILV